MKKNVLTLLGCAGSLSIMLLIGNTANANTDTSKPSSYVLTSSQSTEDLKTALQDPLNSDRIGDLAISKLGCDCAAHRNAVAEMVKSGLLRF